MMERYTLTAKISWTLFATLFAIVTFASPSMAQVVNNGSLNGGPAANSGIQAGNAPPWQRCTYSPDLCSVTFASYTGNSQVPRVASPDGGFWLGVAALGECAYTTISGLTVGNNYTLYFCGANFGTGALYNAANVNILVQVGAASQTYAIPQVANTWNPYSLNFTATSTTMNLDVTAPSGSNGYGSLDGFNLVGNICNPVVLPEVLESFNGERKDCQVLLDWEVPGDYAVEEFEVQRARNGDTYENLGRIPYNSSGVYHFVDALPLVDGNYRLRLHHADGHVAESKSIRVTGSCQGEGLEVLPNPVELGQAANLRFFTQHASTTLVISDMQGKVVKTIQAQGVPGEWNETSFSTYEWESGVYIVRSSEGGTAKMVIQQ